MNIHEIKHGNNWPIGISDGLVLPCALCGKENIQFDYGVTDKLWNKIVPKEIRADVICLSCLDKLAKEKGEDLGSNIVFLQFTGIGMTVKFIPTDVFYYDSRTTIRDKVLEEYHKAWEALSKYDSIWITEGMAKKVGELDGKDVYLFPTGSLMTKQDGPGGIWNMIEMPDNERKRWLRLGAGETNNVQKD